MQCPCKKNCKDRRKAAVNIMLQNKILTSNDLKKKLTDIGIGTYVNRKSLEFLGKEGCQHISVLKFNDGRVARFRAHGRVFFLKKTSMNYQVKRFVTNCLTNLQKKILMKFTRYNRRIYYFSLYDLKKLLPYQGNSIEYAVNKLFNLSLIEQLTIRKTNFFVLPTQLDRLIQEEKTVIEYEKIEYKAVKAVHEIIMSIYPPNLISRYRGAIRPKTSEILTLSGGMTFDIFYKFNSRVIKNEFFVIDVYIRLPVTGYVINSFLKKIEWALRKKGKNVENILKEKTYGLIVFKTATPNAIKIANSKGIRLIRLSDIKLDVERIKELPD